MKFLSSTMNGHENLADAPLEGSAPAVVARTNGSDSTKLAEGQIAAHTPEKNAQNSAPRKSTSSSPRTKSHSTSPRSKGPEDHPVKFHENDPVVSLAIAYRVKKAYEQQLVEVRQALLREQRRRLKGIESSAPSKAERATRALEKRASEIVQKRAEQGKNSAEFLLPQQFVPDALEVWAFCGNHEKSLRVKIGSFRDFERAVLEQEPNATFEAIMIGFLSVIQQQQMGRASKRLVNELTWPEVARRSLYAYINREIAATAAVADEDGNIGDGSLLSDRKSEGTNDEVGTELPLIEDNVVPTWRALEQDPERIGQSVSDKVGDRKVPNWFTEQLARSLAEGELVKLWDEVIMQNVLIRQDFSLRCRGLLNRVRAESYGKLIWVIDYRTLVDPATGEERKRLSTTRKIPGLADLCAVDETLQAGLYDGVSSFQLDVRNCFDTLQNIFSPPEDQQSHDSKKKKSSPSSSSTSSDPLLNGAEAIATANAIALAKAVFEEHLEATRLSRKKFEDLFAAWILHPPPFQQGPWTVWATTDLLEAEMCRLCKGTRKFPRKSGAPNLWQCKKCDTAYHPDCYQALVSGNPLPPIVQTNTSTGNPVGRPKKVLEPSPSGAESTEVSTKTQSEDEDFVCLTCTAMEKDVPMSVKTESADVETNDQQSEVNAIWIAGANCPVEEPEKQKKALLSNTATESSSWYGLLGGKETPVSLLVLANKLGKCEPGELDLCERLRLLLFLCREAASTEPCRQEDEETILQLKDLQSDFSKHRRQWLDDAQRVMTYCLDQFENTVRKELVSGGTAAAGAPAAAGNVPATQDEPDSSSTVSSGDPTNCLTVLQKAFSENEAFAQRETVRGYINRARAFVERGGFLEELECRLEENPDEDSIQLTLEAEDEEDDEEFSRETESDAEDEDDFDTAASRKLLQSMTRTKGGTQVVDTTRFETFFRTLDPETLPEFTTQDAALAKSVDVGPPISKLELHVRHEYLPVDDVRFVHPATMGESTMLECGDDPATCSPSVFGKGSTGLSKTSSKAAEDAMDIEEGLTDEQKKQNTKKRAKPSGREDQDDAEGVATTEDGGDKSKKRRKRGKTVSATGGGAGKDDDGGSVTGGGGGGAEDIMSTATTSCPCCGFRFSQLDKSNHTECQRVFERINSSLSPDRVDTLLAHDLALTLWQAEMDCIASCSRSEPCAVSGKYRYWRFKSDLSMVFAEDMEAGSFSRLSHSVAALSDAPLAIKWFLVANSTSTTNAIASSFPSAVSLGKVRTLLPMIVGGSSGPQPARPVLMDDLRARGKLLMDAVILSHLAKPELKPRSIFDPMPPAPPMSADEAEAGKKTGKSPLPTKKKGSSSSATQKQVGGASNHQTSSSNKDDGGFIAWAGALPVSTSCGFCAEVFDKDEAHCLHCHSTFKLPSTMDENERQSVMEKHSSSCKLLRTYCLRWSLPPVIALYGPQQHVSSRTAWNKFVRTKRMLLDLEASLPLAATRFKVDTLQGGEITPEQRQKVRIMAGGWETERRAMWVDRVKQSVTPLQLMKLTRILEATIDPRWMSPQPVLEPTKVPSLGSVNTIRAESASPIISETAAGGGEKDEEDDGSLVDVVVAQVALRIAAIDQDVRYECVS